MTITIKPINAPSSSKGWLRLKAIDIATGKAVVASSTGNAWISAAHSGEVEPGTRIQITAQEMTRVGKGRTARENVEDYTFFVIAEEGATCKPGSVYTDGQGVAHVSDYLGYAVVTGAALAGVKA